MTNNKTYNKMDFDMTNNITYNKKPFCHES